MSRCFHRELKVVLHRVPSYCNSRTSKINFWNRRFRGRKLIRASRGYSVVAIVMVISSTVPPCSRLFVPTVLLRRGRFRRNSKFRKTFDIPREGLLYYFGDCHIWFMSFRGRGV